MVADGWAEEWADGWAACEGEGKGGVKGLSSRAEVREKVRGEYRFSSLMKQKKREILLRHLHHRIFFCSHDF